MPASYLALADSLEEAINDIQPGGRLPSEHELCSTRRVSRITARGALQELERRHLVRRTRGSGTFVALRIPYPIRPGTSPSWSKIIAEAGHAPSYRLLNVDITPATSGTARALGTEPGNPVVRIERVGSVDGLVAAHHSMHFSLDCFGADASDAERIQAKLETTQSTTALLAEQFGIQIERGATRAELRPIDAKRAAAIDLVGRPMAWHIETVNRACSDHRPIEHTQAWLRADSFQVFMELGNFDKPPRDPNELPNLDPKP